MIGALISGALSLGGSLLSGFGASSAAKSQQRRQEAYDAAARAYNLAQSEAMLGQVPERIAGDADRAGFNPVTWLNAGALGYYSNAYQMRMTTPTQAVNIPNAMQAVGGAISAGSSAFFKQFNIDGAQDFQMQLLDKQLAAISGRGASGGGLSYQGLGLGNVPRQSGGLDTSFFSGSGAPIYGSATTSRGVGGLSFDAGSVRGDGTGLGGFMGAFFRPESTRVYGATPEWNGRIDPMSPDAEAVSKRYGDVFGEATGIYNKLNDPVYAATGRSIATYARDFFDANSDLFSFDPARNLKYFSRNIPNYAGEWNKLKDQTQTWFNMITGEGNAVYSTGGGFGTPANRTGGGF